MIACDHIPPSTTHIVGPVAVAVGFDVFVQEEGCPPPATRAFRAVSRQSDLGLDACLLAAIESPPILMNFFSVGEWLVQVADGHVHLRPVGQLRARDRVQEHQRR